jgi:hypothetical protein
MRRICAAFAVAAIVAATFASVSFQVAGAQAAPGLTCSSSTLVQGSGTLGEVTCTVTGFAPNELVIDDNSGFPAFGVDANGAATFPIESDCGDQPGLLQIPLRGATSGLRVTVELTVIADPQACPPAVPTPLAPPPVQVAPIFTG